MVSGRSAAWTRAATAACIVACLSHLTWAKEPNPSEAAMDGPVTIDQDTADSELGAIEEFTLSARPSYTAKAPPKLLLISAGGEYQLESGIDSAGDFTVTRARAGMGIQFPLGERFSIAFGGKYGFAGYDFDDDAAFGGDEAWGDISTIQGLVAGRYTLDENWSIIAGGIAAFAGEDGGDSSSAFTGGGFIGAGYRASDSLNVDLGVSVVSQLEDDPLVFPVFVVNWAIDDHWQLRAGGLDTGVTDVVGVGVTYHLDEQWSLGAQVGYVRQRFRLDDSGFAPEGVGEDERIKAAIVLTWRSRPHLHVSLLGGMAFAGQVRAEDEDGDRVFEEDYDPAPFVGARLALRF